MRYGAILMALILFAAPASAADLAAHSNWSSLAADRSARQVGDALTIVIYQNSTATNSAENTASKNTTFQGSFSAGNPIMSNGVNASANLGLNHGADNVGTTARSGQMVAQISVVVDAILSNGDLHVSGTQALKINGENTNIRVGGRVRPADISASNMVLSTSLAEATIVYDGAGFVSASSEPGVLTKVLNWLGLP